MNSDSAMATSRLFEHGRSFKTEANAIRKLKRAAAKIGVDMAVIKWAIIVTSDGRYAPAVFRVDVGLGICFAEYGVHYFL